MTNKNTVLSRFAIDLSGAFIGLFLGMLCLKFFRGGMVLPLDNADWIVLVSTTFTAMLLSSVFHKSIRRFLKPISD